MPKTATPDNTEQRRSRAYNRAVRTLREEFPDRWGEIIAAEYEIEGLEYRPRLSPEQKAKKQIEALLAEFPSLKDDVPF